MPSKSGNHIATVRYPESELFLVAERAKELILSGVPVAVNYNTIGEWSISFPVQANHPPMIDQPGLA